MGFLSRLFGSKGTPVADVLKAGATIIDVRTAAEFRGGHVKGSVNIPLDQLNKKMAKIKLIKTPVVLCCASGMRSANALSVLKRHNLADVYNGGSWGKVNRLLNS